MEALSRTEEGQMEMGRALIEGQKELANNIFFRTFACPVKFCIADTLQGIPLGPAPPVGEERRSRYRGPVKFLSSEIPKDHFTGTKGLFNWGLPRLPREIHISDSAAYFTGVAPGDGTGVGPEDRTGVKPVFQI